MDWEFLIPLLMFAFPVAVALLDKRAKKRKGVPKVQSRPVFPPAQGFPETRALAPDRVSDYPALPLEGAQGVKNSTRSDWSAEGATASEEDLRSRSKQEEEGQRAISRKRRKEAEMKDVNPEPKFEIDKKKLIIYSEILKPKYDN